VLDVNTSVRERAAREADILFAMPPSSIGTTRRKQGGRAVRSRTTPRYSFAPRVLFAYFGGGDLLPGRSLAKKNVRTDKEDRRPASACVVALDLLLSVVCPAGLILGAVRGLPGWR
jgi:hypothetical protein